MTSRPSLPWTSSAMLRLLPSASLGLLNPGRGVQIRNPEGKSRGFETVTGLVPSHLGIAELRVGEVELRPKVEDVLVEGPVSNELGVEPPIAKSFDLSTELMISSALSLEDLAESGGEGDNGVVGGVRFGESFGEVRLVIGPIEVGVGEDLSVVELLDPFSASLSSARDGDGELRDTLSCVLLEARRGFFKCVPVSSVGEFQLLFQIFDLVVFLFELVLMDSSAGLDCLDQVADDDAQGFWGQNRVFDDGEG